MLLTPESIRTLQRKLYRKAKQQPAFRFYALYDKVYRDDILSHAYSLMRANQGSAGVDGVTFKAIEQAEGEGRWMCAETTEIVHIISRGSRVGMYSKIYCPVLETRCGGGEATGCGV